MADTDIIDELFPYDSDISDREVDEVLEILKEEQEREALFNIANQVQEAILIRAHDYFEANPGQDSYYDQASGCYVEIHVVDDIKERVILYPGRQGSVDH